MKTKVLSLTSARFAQMLTGAINNLSLHRAEVNDLNVFPVPDGDTGDNMLMTLEAVQKDINSLNASSVEYFAETNQSTSTPSDDPSTTGIPLSAFSRRVAGTMLLSARGNSGVILSQIFKGLADGLANYTETDTSGFNHALKSAVSAAYSVVANPVEGTILSVFKDAVTFAEQNLSSTTPSAISPASTAASATTGESVSLETYFDNLLAAMRTSLAKTTSQMQVLADAGVVDSGAAGLLYIFEGMQNGLLGNITSDTANNFSTNSNKTLNLDLFTENSELEYGYCTEFLLRLQVAKNQDKSQSGSVSSNTQVLSDFFASFDLDAFIAQLNSLGNSVVAFRNGSILKTHVHTKTPGKVLNYAQKFGEFLTLKIENMTLQHNNREHDFASTRPAKTAPQKTYALVSVASGQGIKALFKDLGVEVVIDGGVNMNPSTEDFLNAFDTAHAKTIFVFPNNKNTILTANQAASMYQKSDIRVIPTKNIGEAYAVIGNLDFVALNSANLATSTNSTAATNPESPTTPDTLVAEAIEITNNTPVGFVVKASKTTVLDDIKIEAGYYFGFTNDQTYACAENREDTLKSLTKSLSAQAFAVALLIYGDKVDAKTAETAKTALAKAFPTVEFILISGNQKLHDYILILE